MDDGNRKSGRQEQGANRACRILVVPDPDASESMRKDLAALERLLRRLLRGKGREDPRR